MDGWLGGLAFVTVCTIISVFFLQGDIRGKLIKAAEKKKRTLELFDSLQ